MINEKRIESKILTLKKSEAAVIWAKTLSFLWFKFHIQTWSIWLNINFERHANFTPNSSSVVFVFFHPSLVAFSRFQFEYYLFLCTLIFLLVNFMEYSFKSCHISIPFVVVLFFKLTFVALNLFDLFLVEAT